MNVTDVVIEPDMTKAIDVDYPPPLREERFARYAHRPSGPRHAASRFTRRAGLFDPDQHPRDDEGKFAYDGGTERRGRGEANEERDGATRPVGSITKGGGMVVANGQVVKIGDRVAIKRETGLPFDRFITTSYGEVKSINETAGVGVKLDNGGRLYYKPEDVYEGKGVLSGKPAKDDGLGDILAGHDLDTLHEVIPQMVGGTVDSFAVGGTEYENADAIVELFTKHMQASVSRFARRAYVFDEAAHPRDVGGRFTTKDEPAGFTEEDLANFNAVNGIPSEAPKTPAERIRDQARAAAERIQAAMPGVEIEVDSQLTMNEDTVDAVNGAAAGFEQMARDYPEIAARIGTIEFGPTDSPDALGQYQHQGSDRVYEGIAPPGVYGGAHMPLLQIDIAQIASKAHDLRLAEDAERRLGINPVVTHTVPAERAGFSVERLTEGIAVHEFGHAVYYAAPSPVQMHATADVAFQANLFNDHISAYAATNQHEYFAEAFTANELGMGDRLTDQDRNMLRVAGVDVALVAAAPVEIPDPPPDTFEGSIIWEYAREVSDGDAIQAAYEMRLGAISGLGEIIREIPDKFAGLMDEAEDDVVLDPDTGLIRRTVRARRAYAPDQKRDASGRFAFEDGERPAKVDVKGEFERLRKDGLRTGPGQDLPPDASPKNAPGMRKSDEILWARGAPKPYVGDHGGPYGRPNEYMIAAAAQKMGLDIPDAVDWTKGRPAYDEGRAVPADRIERAADNLLKSIRNGEPAQPVLWRGVREGPGRVKEYAPGMYVEDSAQPRKPSIADWRPEVGDVVKLPPMSFSRSPATAGLYGGTKPPAILRVREGATGYAVRNEYPWDQEVITAGTFRVNGVQRSGDTTFIDMEQVEIP